MCIRNINAVISVYRFNRVENSNEKLDVDYNDEIKSINSVAKDGKKIINDIAVKISMNILSSGSNQDENVIDRNGILECELRLVKDMQAGNMLVSTLDTFILDFTNETNLKIEEDRGRKFCNFSRIVLFDSIILPDDDLFGIYNFELVLNRKIDDKDLDKENGDLVQSAYNLSIS